VSLAASLPGGGDAGGGHVTVLYDRDCGFCRWSLRWLRSWDRDGRVRAVALQDAEAERLLGDLDAGDRMASWHLIDAQGRRSSAGAALAPLLRELHGGAALARALEAAPRVADTGYALVARHRSGLGRLVRTLGGGE
jgi:predicted DCC family thiol-disulfide oxidoreductase YuxK